MKKLFLLLFLGFLSFSYADENVNPKKPLVLTVLNYQINNAVLNDDCSTLYNTSIINAYASYYAYIASLPTGFPSAFYEHQKNLAGRELNRNLTSAFTAFRKCNSIY